MTDIAEKIKKYLTDQGTASSTRWICSKINESQSKTGRVLKKLAKDGVLAVETRTEYDFEFSGKNCRNIACRRRRNYYWMAAAKKTIEWKEKSGYLSCEFGTAKVGGEITLEERPPYCDRGRYFAKVFTNGIFVDEADCWPRYYFDLERAKAECEAWIEFRLLKTEAKHGT